MVRYYSTERPVSVGTYPKPAFNRVLKIENFESKQMCREIGREAWGYIEYDHALSLDLVDAADYELVAAINVVHKLRFIGLDDFDRRVYIDEAGTIWKDPDVSNKPPLRHNMLTNAVGNRTDGEPEFPMGENEDYIILEARKV